MAIRFIDESPQPATPTKPRIRFVDEAQKEQSILDVVGQALDSRSELKAYGEGNDIDLTNPIDVARGTLTAPIRTGATLLRGPDALGEVVSGEVNRAGYPKTGAAVGTLISMAPEIVAGGSAVRGMRTSQAPLMKGIRMRPKDFAPEFEMGERQAGIRGTLPERRGAMARFPGGLSRGVEREVAAESLPMAPASYPKDPNTFINFAKARMRAFNGKLSPQELDDYKKIISEMFRKGELAPGTQQYATATGLSKDVTALHNMAVPGRADLNKAYAYSRNIRAKGAREFLAGFAKKYGKKALEGLAFAGGGAYAAKKVFEP